MKKEIEVFNIKINPSTLNEFVEYIYSNLLNGKKIVQNGVNSFSIIELAKTPELMQAFNNSELASIDGMSLVWALKFLGYSVPERVACPDLAEEILALANEKKLRVYFLGSSQQNLKMAVKNITSIYPDLIIAGYRNGYFGISEEPMLVEEINNTNTHILFLGMPTPKKELFMENYKDKLIFNYSLGVGGLFDIFSGKTKRAPKWMQKHGFEWFYRLIQEPRRMWKRYLFGNSKFIYLVLKEKFSRPKQTNKPPGENKILT
jgi:N-acetylglucosaminyldiphosphoundecaprenol N-acetyl-beta-D-mannosaminyltransferase